MVDTAATYSDAMVQLAPDVRLLPGTVILHGAFETHPITVCGNVMREDTHYVDHQTFIKRQSVR